MNLGDITDEELRAEARRRGFELHSVRFSQAAQNALRELEGLRRRIDELMAGLRGSPPALPANEENTSGEAVLGKST